LINHQPQKKQERKKSLLCRFGGCCLMLKSEKWEKNKQKVGLTEAVIQSNAVCKQLITM
jgi:hypothetical protein